MNVIHDNRINADNYMLEMTIGEYFELVQDSLNDNEYQRKRVRNASSVYNLLKRDLIQGCIMPPIVLAYSEQIKDPDRIVKELRASKNNIKILDGLQRSYTIKEIVSEYSNKNIASNPLSHKIRVEVYTGLNKIGLLYRMLTLNTGQTQMTTRHQIEIIYSDYKEKCMIDGVKLLTEVDDKSPKELGEYKFRDVVDGFTSYMEQNYLTLDRMDILENVKNLERLSDVGLEENVFDDFLRCYHRMVEIIHKTYPYEIEADQLITNLNLEAAPYANSVVKMFNRSQPMTGFGNAIATLQSKKIVEGFTDLWGKIETIDSTKVEMGFMAINKNMDDVRRIAKKIGNDQRLYFYQFFKKLFDKNEESFLNMNEAAKSAFKEYDRIVS